jgi:predicted transcriptional regulator
MSESGPPTDDLAAEFGERLSDAPTDERVYRVAIELTEPTTVAEIANRAECSKNAARRHLKRLTDIGVLTTVVEDPATFKRNESYFEWRRLNRLAELSEEEYKDRLGDLLAEHESYKETYGVDSPGELDPFEYEAFGDSETVWLDLNNWVAIRTEIRDLRRARDGSTVDEGLA